MFLRDCSVVSPMALLLFGTSFLAQHVDSCVVVNEWVKVRCPGQAAALLGRVRGALDWLLRKRLEGRVDEREDMLVDCVVQLLWHEEASLAL